MRRNIVITAVTAAALVGGGTATALATSGADGRGTASRADASVSDDGGVRDDGGAGDDSDDRGDGEVSSSRDGSDRGSGANAKVTAAEAIAAALRDTPGTAVSAELDEADDDGDDSDDRYDDGRGDRRERAVWELGIVSGDGTWHSVRVDPATGEVLGSHSDDEDDDTAEVRSALRGASVTAADAAQAAAGKGTVTSVDLDDDGEDGDGDDGTGRADRGGAAWEVETHSSGHGEQDWRVDLRTGEVTADPDDD